MQWDPWNTPLSTGYQEHLVPKQDWLSFFLAFFLKKFKYGNTVIRATCNMRNNSQPDTPVYTPQLTEGGSSEKALYRRDRRLYNWQIRHISMGVDHEGQGGQVSPQNLERGTLMQIVPQILSYRYKNERSVAFKIRQNPFSAGALPRNPLGELTMLPQIP